VNASRRDHRLWLPVMALSLALLAMAGCTVGPHYVRPKVAVPGAFKDNGGAAATASARKLPDKWWELFHDPELNQLEAEIAVSNQNLKQARAQYAQARALVRYYRAGEFPMVTAGASVIREHLAANRPPRSTFSGKTYSDFMVPGSLSYEVDAWGRVRKTVESAKESAQASAADLATVNLSLQSELAVDYFELRSADAQKQLLESTAADYEKSLQLTENRYKGGLASDLDVQEAKTQLEATRSQSIDVQVARAQFEHAIAVLTGKPPSSFTLAAVPLTASPPVVPVGLPSQILEQRPDVAAAERRVAAANAQIGVAKAAYFPQLSLTGAGGFESGSLTTLLQGPGGFWSVGAGALETVFEGGRRHAVTEAAWDSYNQTVAAYRQTVLTAFQDTEDNLSALRILSQEAQTQDLAVQAAQRSATLSLNEYRGGLVDYLQVLTAQTAALTAQRAAIDILRRRMDATVGLMQALGGGWDTAKLPAP
jgi:NodT family efflux transporter outer membrane factor (OMF) lipoprotein